MQPWTFAEPGFVNALNLRLGAFLKTIALAVSGMAILAACGTIEPVTSKGPQPAGYDPVGPVGPPSPEAAPSSAAKAPPTTERPAARTPRTDRPAAQARAGKLPYSGGAYFENDGPGENIPANIDAIPDAKPRKEALASWANRPYTLFGRQYVPEREIKPFKQQGVASWYGRKFHGAKTANGERYDMYAMTAAHPTLPLPSYARVTNARTGQSVVVRVNDRGPFLNNRVIDLSYTAAHKLGYLEKGFAEVVVEQIAFEDSAERPQLAANPSLISRDRLNVADRAVTEQRTADNAVSPSTERLVNPQSPMLRTAVKGHTENGLTELSSRLEIQPVIPAPAEADQVTLERAASTQLHTARLDAKQVRAGNSNQTADADKQPTRSPLYLQMGAFQNRNNAIWVQAWMEEHFDAVAGKLEIFENDGWFKVQVGPYATRTDALALQAQIREATDFAPFLAVRPVVP